MIRGIISKFLYPPTACSYKEDKKCFCGNYFEIQKPGGGSIPCVYFRSSTLARYTIVYSHANAEDIGQLCKLFKWMCKYLYVDVIGYDYPGYGLHKGIASEESLKESACLMINYVIDTLSIHPSQIILYGHSLGSAISAFLSVYISKTRECSVAGVVLHSCFMSIYRIVFDVRFSAKKDQFETADIIKDINSPVTFIHGTDDGIVPISHPKRLFQLVPEKYRFRCLFMEHVGHNGVESYWSPQSVFVNHLLDFFTFVSKMQQNPL